MNSDENYQISCMDAFCFVLPLIIVFKENLKIIYIYFDMLYLCISIKSSSSFNQI